MMNHSRLSYTMPPDAKYAYSPDVILHKCEFCNRTFIPDSLMKHRKVCYRDYLKKRSKISNLTSRTMVRSKSALSSYKIPQGVNLTALMISRQKRRMNWRDRHEEFIQTIRSAREYSIALDSGLNVHPPPNSMDHKEDMRQCKYCLRKFQKGSLEKHLTFCKEHSIRCSRSRPNEAHIQAKRRLSLRLYYKPRSFRGDSPDDQTTSISSRDLDCASTATFNSRNMNTDMSQASVISTKSSFNLRSRTASAATISVSNALSVPKNEASFVSNKVKQRQSMEGRSNSHHRKISNDYQDKLPKRQTNYKGKKNDNIPMTTQSKSVVSNNGSDKSKVIRRRSIAHKLKAISSLLGNNEAEVPRSELSEIKFSGPNPSESFHKAKEILQYLNLRVKENELTQELRDFANGASDEDNKYDRQVDVDDRLSANQNEVGDVNLDDINHYNNASNTQNSNAFSNYESTSNDLIQDREQLDLSELLSEIIDVNDTGKNRMSSANHSQQHHFINDQYNGNLGQNDRRKLLRPIDRRHLSVHRDTEYLQMWHQSAAMIE